MSSLARILKPVLADYAKELLAAGFRVYVFKSDVERVAKGGRESVGTWFQFSREVDGQVCYASVGLGFFESPSFSMPIKPSTKNGSSMWVGGSTELRQRDGGYGYSEALDLRNAELYASPFNSNPLVGRQANYADSAWQERLYVEMSA
ncbi:MAG TPA: hypothetical protein VIT65_10690 [Microlunatus sp.]